MQVILRSNALIKWRIDAVIKSFIKIIIVFVIAVITPIVINIAYMIGSDKQNTVFEASHLLAYAGACIFGLAVYWQTHRMHEKNRKMQERTLRLEDYNLQYNTFVFLNILKVETTADRNPVKTHKLKKAIPWPLDVRACALGFPNGIPHDFPKRWQKHLKKQLPALPLGNSEEYQEGEVFKREFICYEVEYPGGSSTSTLTIDPSIGVFHAVNTSALVLWSNFFPIPRHYPYYTHFEINFFGKSSRENFFVGEIEIHSFELTLEGKNKKIYGFKDKLDYFADCIWQPLRVKPTTIAENSYYGSKYNCDHFFSVELHLCHNYPEMLDIIEFDEIDINFVAVYINTFGVRTKRRQGFKIGASVKEAVETGILGDDGLPRMREEIKKIELQHYVASDLSIEINRKTEE